MDAHRGRGTQEPRRAAALALLGAGCVVLAAGAVDLSGARLWAPDLWYLIAWWSLIAILDACVHLRAGRSLLLSRPGPFLGLAAASAPFWLFFEIVNLRLENWYYVGVPGDWVSRWVGPLAAFATVLPGVVALRAALAAGGFVERARTATFRVSARAARALVVAGVACLLLPLAFPDWAYPLIWGAVPLACEPYLLRRGEPSLLLAWSRGDPRPILRTLAAGALAGGLWEALNWPADARWIYTVPGFEEAKVFEMPWLGFVGFLPFALACVSFARLVVVLGTVAEWDPSLPARPARSRAVLLGSACALAVSGPGLIGLNARTVRATTPCVAGIPGIDPRFVDCLERVGLGRVERWLSATAPGAHPESARHAGMCAIGIAESSMASWSRCARLMQVRGLGSRGVGWLAVAGIEDVAALARADAETLVRRFTESSPAGLDGPVPSRAEVRVWIRGAIAAHAER